MQKLKSLGFGGLENMKIGGTSTRSEPEFWQAGGPGKYVKSQEIGGNTKN